MSFNFVINLLDTEILQRLKMAIRTKCKLTLLFLLSITCSLIQAEREKTNHTYVDMLARLQVRHKVRPPSFESHPLKPVSYRELIMPPRCDTRAEGKHNPCYVCHQDVIPTHEKQINRGHL